LYLLEEHIAQKLSKEFPQSWNEQSLWKLLNKLTTPVKLTGIQGASNNERRILWKMWSCCWPHVQSGRCITDSSVSTWNFKE